MLSLSDFLLARYDELEAAANAATGTHWSVKHEEATYGQDRAEAWAVDTDARNVWQGRDLGTLAAVAVEYDRDYSIPSGGCEREPDAVHIARHDPAYVLADIAAKRRVVELHGPLGLTWWDVTMCARCQGDSAPVPDPLGSGSTWTPNATYPCATLLALAQPFADHPDYPHDSQDAAAHPPSP